MEKPRPCRFVRGLLRISGQFAVLKSPVIKKRNTTADEVNNLAIESKQLGKELNLSDSQKEQLRTFLTEKYEQLQEYKKQNPHITKEDIVQYVAKNRAAGRENIEKFNHCCFRWSGALVWITRLLKKA